MSGLDKDIQDKWNTIEDKFLNSKEDIVALLIGYIKTHKSTFEY
jgi:hypothetical protein